MKLLIDTDIGDDIDDALALGYAFARGLKIVGVTTVYRQAPERSAIVRKLMAYCGLTDIPVLAGYSEPLSREAVVFGRMNYCAADYPQADNPPEDAARFMADCADRYEEELCILLMGAQTNLAHACMRYPDQMKKVGLVAVMGGCFTLHHNEWNIAGDPTAARIVGESGLPLFYMPWDVTREIELGEENYRRILDCHEDTMQGYIAHLVGQWRERNLSIPSPLLHDPAMLICTLDRSLCETREVPFCVVDTGPAAGITLNVATLNRFALGELPAHTITLAVAAEKEKIVSDYMQTVFGAPVAASARLA